MQLWEKKCFDLEDDVSKYLDFDVKHPMFPDIPITFKMLATHTASFADNFEDDHEIGDPK